MRGARLGSAGDDLRDGVADCRRLELDVARRLGRSEARGQMDRYLEHVASRVESSASTDARPVPGSRRALADLAQALLEAGLLHDRLDFLDDLVRREQLAEAELRSDLEQVLHIGGPLLAPRLADGGKEQVRVAAHALVVEGGAPFGERFDVPVRAAALDLEAAEHLVDDGDAVVARAAALAGVAVVAVPERVVREQGGVAVQGAPGDLARDVLGEAGGGAAGGADAALDAALEAVLVVVHARVVQDALDELGVAPRRRGEGVLGDDGVRVDRGVGAGRLLHGHLDLARLLLLRHEGLPPDGARRPGRTRARSTRGHRGAAAGRRNGRCRGTGRRA